MRGPGEASQQLPRVVRGDCVNDELYGTGRLESLSHLLGHEVVVERPRRDRVAWILGEPVDERVDDRAAEAVLRPASSSVGAEEGHVEDKWTVLIWDVLRCPVVSHGLRDQESSPVGLPVGDARSRGQPAWSLGDIDLFEVVVARPQSNRP